MRLASRQGNLTRGVLQNSHDGPEKECSRFIQMSPDRETERLERDREQLIAQRDRLSAHAAQLESSVRHLRQRVERLDVELAAIRSSHSWLVTRPFRVSARLLKGTLSIREAIKIAKSELRGTIGWPSRSAKIPKHPLHRSDVDEVLLELKHALAQSGPRRKR